MALFSFYNVRKPRQFNHKPIYWDPRKEALDERVRKVEVEMGVREDTQEEYKSHHIKGSFAAGMSHLRKSRARGDDMRNRTTKNVRLLLILVVLIAIFWVLFLR